MSDRGCSPSPWRGFLFAPPVSGTLITTYPKRNDEGKYVAGSELQRAARLRSGAHPALKMPLRAAARTRPGGSRRRRCLPPLAGEKSQWRDFVRRHP